MEKPAVNMESPPAGGSPQQAQTVSTARRIAGTALLYLSRVCMAPVLARMLLAAVDMGSEVLDKPVFGWLGLSVVWITQYRISLAVSICLLVICIAAKARHRKSAAILVGAMLSVYVCLFLFTVRALAVRHLDDGFFYSMLLLVLGLLLLADTVGHAALLRNKALPHWRWVSFACFLAGFICLVVSSSTPCCTGG